MTIKQLNFTETQITEAVCKYLNVSFKELDTTSRERKLVYARQLCMWLLQHHTRMSQKNIADLFGRDHATVHHARKQIGGLLKVDAVVQYDMAHIKKSIGL